MHICELASILKPDRVNFETCPQTHQWTAVQPTNCRQTGTTLQTDCALAILLDKTMVASYRKLYLNSRRNSFSSTGNVGTVCDGAKRYSPKAWKVKVSNCNNCQLHLLCSKHQNGGVYMKIGEWSADILSITYCLVSNEKP